MDRLNDFSDRLSPMLVKELRQGLRTNTFIILFLVLQGFLALIILTSAAADTGAGSFISGVIFSFFSLAVLVVQPLRGMSAISSELKGDTIDLMALTKLSAWRIVFGKWSSIVGQTALIFCAIIPYLILRYFFGGMQLFAELFLLFTIFTFSGVFTAITVGLSACSLALVRLLPLLGALLLIFPIFIVSFENSALSETLELFAPTSRDHWLTLLGIYAIASYVGYFFLELATTSIAPASQNRATRKRLISLVAVTSTFLLLSPIEIEPAWVISGLLLTLITLDLFTESADYPSIVLKPFLRFGWFSRLGARLLAPGWASGYLFFLLLCGALALISLVRPSPSPLDEDVVRFLAFLFGALNFNLLIVNLFKRRFPQRFVPYLFISVLLTGLLPLFAILDSARNSDGMLPLLSWIPYAFPFLDSLLSPAVLWLISGCYATANLVFALFELRKMSELEKAWQGAPEEQPEETLTA